MNLINPNANSRFCLSDIKFIKFIGDDIRTIKRNTDILPNACTDIGLTVNTGKTKYMEKGRHRGMIANEHIKIPIKK